MFLKKCVLNICSKLTGEHSCRSVISIKLQSNFIEITLQHGYSPVKLLHIFRTPFPRNTSGGLLLKSSKLEYDDPPAFCSFLRYLVTNQEFEVFFDDGNMLIMLKWFLLPFV